MRDQTILGARGVSPGQLEINIIDSPCTSRTFAGVPGFRSGLFGSFLSFALLTVLLQRRPVDPARRLAETLAESSLLSLTPAVS